MCVCVYSYVLGLNVVSINCFLPIIIFKKTKLKHNDFMNKCK